MDLNKVGGSEWRNCAPVNGNAIQYFDSSNNTIKRSQVSSFKRDAKMLSKSDSVEKMLGTIREKKCRKFVID